MRNNIITLTDSYKMSHWKIYPDKLEVMYSYFESRDGAKWDKTMFFGLQYIIKEYFEGVVVTKEGIAEAKALVDAHMGPGVFNEKGWTRLLEKHGGKLPLRIKAVKEGSLIPVSNVMMTIENTDQEFPFLTNFAETILTQNWYGSAVATNSYEQKKIIYKYLQETGDVAGLGYKLHNFGFRGSSSVESAGISDAGHLANFYGTDTIKGIELARDYYDGGVNSHSIVATEHSLMSVLGRDGETEMARRVLEQNPTGLVAIVGDTYDIFNFCENIVGGELRDLVLGRDGTLVVRPDSGDPVKILPEILSILGSKFGQAKNAKGYYVLNDKVRVIQGDAVGIETLPLYLEAIKEAGYSADNIAFGSGGGLVAKVDRDTQRNAYKCSAAKIDGEWRDVYKDPITAREFAKKSKAGRLALVPDGDSVKTIKVEGEADHPEDLLEVVFENGVLLRDQKFEDIRRIANKEFEAKELTTA